MSFDSHTVYSSDTWSLSTMMRISRPAWYFSGRILKQDTLGVTQMKIFDLFVWLWRRVDALIPWPPTSIIAIAVKEPRPNR